MNRYSQIVKVINAAKPEEIDSMLASEAENLGKIMPRTKAAIQTWSLQRKNGATV